MKIVRVIYTATPEYAQQNSANINVVMNDLQRAAHPGIFYHACLGADGKTFTHTAFFKSEEDHKLLNALPTFKVFQEKLQAAGFEVPPKQESLTLVGSSKNIF
jgi:hypothetical protein